MVRSQKVLGIMLLVAAASNVAMAAPVAAPEIGPASAGSALALVSGIVMMIRGRKK